MTAALTGNRPALPAQWPAALSPACLEVIDMPTPYLVTDLDTVVRRLRAFTAALPGVHPHYAMKCNPSPEILATLRDEGAGFEIASLGELQLLERLGVDPVGVLYSNPVKPPAHIAAAYAAGLLALVGLVQLLTTLARNPAPRQGAALALLLLPAVAEGFVALAALLAAADLPLLAGLPLVQAGSFSLFVNPTVQLVWAGLVAAAVLLLAGGQRAAPAPKGVPARNWASQRQAAPKVTVVSETAAPASVLTPAPSRPGGAAASTLKWDDDF